MLPFRFIPFLIFPCLAASSPSYAPNPIGTWTGRIVVNLTNLNKKLPAKTQQNIRSQALRSASTQVTLILKANHSYTASNSGAAKVARPDVGTWKQSGSTVTLTSKAKAMEARPTGKQVFQLSPKGDLLTLNLPPYQGVTAKLVLKRKVKGK